MAQVAAGLLLVSAAGWCSPHAHAACTTKVKTAFGTQAVEISCGKQTTSTVKSSPDDQRKSTNDSGVRNTAPDASLTLQPVDERWLTCNTTDPACLEAKSAGTVPALPTPPAPGQVQQPVLTYQLIQQAVMQMGIPKPAPQVGPDPSLNEWGIVAVGYPIWLWVDGPSVMTQSVTTQGITINLVARRTRVVFDMGDGQEVTCTDMPEWPGPSSTPKPSPSCGYAYQRLPKTPGAGYEMGVTAFWDVGWSALGQGGTLALSTTGGRLMPVGELQSVVVPNGQR